jgi:hypothetical protein
MPVYDTTHAQPLAYLDPLPTVRYTDVLTVAPDGRAILVRGKLGTGNGYVLFRPTGRDCPESPLGVLAFPHTWLLALGLTAATLSLRRDARRRAAHGTEILTPFLVLPLLIVAVVLTLHFAIEACLGHIVQTPAPLLLLGAVGLATGSRLWRLLALALLIATVAWCARGLMRFPATPVNTYGLFDRTYDLPQRLRFVSMLLATSAALAGVGLLARGTRALRA